MTVLCIIPGPSVELRREPDDRETRWCFTCRKRLAHEWVLMGDPEPPQWVRDALHLDGLDGYTVRELMSWFSYYDPTWSLRCPEGHSATCFPDPL